MVTLFEQSGEDEFCSWHSNCHVYWVLSVQNCSRSVHFQMHECVWCVIAVFTHHTSHYVLSSYGNSYSRKFQKALQTTNLQERMWVAVKIRFERDTYRLRALKRLHLSQSAQNATRNELGFTRKIAWNCLKLLKNCLNCIVFAWNSLPTYWLLLEIYLILLENSRLPENHNLISPNFFEKLLVKQIINDKFKIDPVKKVYTVVKVM